MSYDREADIIRANASTEDKAEKIFGWLLSYLSEYCEENAEDGEEAERLYEEVWKKFAK